MSQTASPGLQVTLGTTAGPLSRRCRLPPLDESESLTRSTPAQSSSSGSSRHLSAATLSSESLNSNTPTQSSCTGANQGNPVRQGRRPTWPPAFICSCVRCSDLVHGGTFVMATEKDLCELVRAHWRVSGRRDKSEKSEKRMAIFERQAMRGHSLSLEMRRADSHCAGRSWMCV